MILTKLKYLQYIVTNSIQLFIGGNNLGSLRDHRHWINSNHM